MNSKIVNFLVELKNASLARKETVSIEYSHLLENLVEVLYREGFIQSFIIKRNYKSTEKKVIQVGLRYYFNKPVFNNLKLFSKPSYLKYMKFSDICNIPNKRFVCFFSTNQGILTTLDCKRKKIGGKLLFMC
jgi:small subunit ribosomal protein S8